MVNKNKSNSKNKIVIGLGSLLIVIGFILLSQGPGPNNPLSLTVAPLVLVFAYLVIIPFGILWFKKSETQKEGD
jgi:hypothetical protein